MATPSGSVPPRRDRPRPSTRWRPALRALAALLLASALVVGCSTAEDPGLLGDGTATGPVSPAEAQALLDARAVAVRSGDQEAFLATLDRSNADLVARQRRLFANFQRLPLASLTYTVLKSEWPEGLRDESWGSFVSVPQVRIATQLAGFDTVPVTRVTGFAFTRMNGLPVIVSELTGAGQPFPGSRPAPWDLVRIKVRADGPVLQIYDDATWRRADQIDDTLRRGIADVRDGLPFDWDGRVVVYVFSDQKVLDSFEGVPGGNINHLGAMTFPMYAVVGQEQVAGIRFTLLPSSIRAGAPFLDRITRHELTHVALGDRDDGVPIWVAEGVAEYLGARSIPEDERRIATVAVKKARQGVSGMPSTATFNGDDQAWNYALSWMACDYIVATQGEPRLWQLVEVLHNGGEGTPESDQDRVLQEVLGFDSAELATQAARRILRIYG